MRRMNKSALIGAFLAVLVVVSFAARYEEFICGKLIVENTATLEGTLAVTGAATFSSTVAATEAVVDGKYAVVGPDATTGLMVQAGSCTNGETITFSPVFGATPYVVGNYSEDAGADAVIEFTSTTATSTVVVATAAKTINYIAVGARP